MHRACQNWLLCVNPKVLDTGNSTTQELPFTFQLALVPCCLVMETSVHEQLVCGRDVESSALRALTHNCWITGEACY